jgi:hypothetical protein
MFKKPILGGFYVITAILLIVFSLTGCGGPKDTPTSASEPIIQGVTVSVFAGSYLTNSAASNSFSYDHGWVNTMVVSGGTVYIAGYDNSTPCYWEEFSASPESLSLPSAGNGQGSANCSTVSNGTVYFAGSYQNAEDNTMPCYWAGPGANAQVLNVPVGAVGWVSAVVPLR